VIDRQFRDSSRTDHGVTVECCPLRAARGLALSVRAPRVEAEDAADIVEPYSVLGEAFPHTLRRLLDIPAYWLVLLPIELPATSIADALALTVALRSAMPRPERLALASLACLASTGLIVSWLLVSTLGENNDLGLRAIIHAEMVLIVAAAAGCLPTAAPALPAANWRSPWRRCRRRDATRSTPSSSASSPARAPPPT